MAEVKKLLMAKSTPEEIIRKKEYVRFLNTQIYKLTSQQKFLHKQLDKLEAQLKDYEKEKNKNRKLVKRELTIPSIQLLQITPQTPFNNSGSLVIRQRIIKVQ